MSRSLPVLYASSTLQQAGQARLVSAVPSPESTATSIEIRTLGAEGYLVPESGTPNGSPNTDTFKGVGWNAQTSEHSVPESGAGWKFLPDSLVSCDSTTDLIYIHDGISGAIVSSFASPSSNPEGVTVDPGTGNLISCDSNADRIYVHDGITGTILSSFASPGSTPQGITIDPSTGNLISCDSNADRIYVHDGVTGTILSSFASPSFSPTGITVDPGTGNLISCDSSEDRIYIHDGITGTILSSFASPGSVPQGITIDPSTGNLISCDSFTDRIYIHDGISGTILSSFASPGPLPTDLSAAAPPLINLRLHYSRAGGLLTGNVSNVALTVRAYAVSQFATGNGADTLLGTATTTIDNVTPADQSVDIAIPVSAPFDFGVTDTGNARRLGFEIYVDGPVQLVGDRVRFHTNSSIGLRILSAPRFTIQYSTTLADSVPAVADGLQRGIAYFRDLADAPPGVADAVSRQVTRPRTISDAPPAPADDLERQMAYNRTLADAAPVTDDLARQMAYNRALADAAPTVADDLTRQANYNRALSDSAPPVDDALTRQVQANRTLTDTVPTPDDDLSRQAEYARTLADSAPVADELDRTMVYRRTLIDNIREGGGDVVNKFFPVNIFDD